MKQLYIILGLLCLIVSSCSSHDEPEPLYNWWVCISVNEYEIGVDVNDLTWIRESRHDERYELNKTESYLKEQQAKYDGKKGLSNGYLFVFSYSYKKIDYIPITSSETFP